MFLYCPLSLQLVRASIACAYIMAKRLVDRDRRYGPGFLSPRSTLASGSGSVPVLWMGVFAFWEQYGAAFQMVSPSWIADAEHTALSNMSVMWTALFAWAFLGSRFKLCHYAGCTLMLISVLVAVMAIHIGIGSGELSGAFIADGRVTGAIGSITAVTYLAYFVGAIPVGAINCYKQRVAQGADLDLVWATFWSGNLQVVWGVLMYGLNWIPRPGPGGTKDHVEWRYTHSPSTLGRDLAESWACLTGSALVDDRCATDEVLLCFTGYVVCSAFFNLFMLWFAKHLSATWASIGGGLCGYSSGVVGNFSSLPDWLGLLISSVAISVYSMEAEVDVGGKAGYQEQADSKAQPEILA